MTREQLRRFVDEAEGKQQTALVIWRNWRTYEEHHISAEKDEVYQMRLHAAGKGIPGHSYLWTAYNSHSVLFITVPIKEMKTSPELFEKVLELCQSEADANTVVLEPMHELSELCEKK